LQLQKLISSGHSFSQIKKYTQDELIYFLQAEAELNAIEFSNEHAKTAHAMGNMSTNDFLKAIKNEY
jgi:hypothetical protein